MCVCVCALSCIGLQGFQESICAVNDKVLLATCTTHYTEIVLNTFWNISLKLCPKEWTSHEYFTVYVQISWTGMGKLRKEQSGLVQRTYAALISSLVAKAQYLFLFHSYFKACKSQVGNRLQRCNSM